MANTIVVHVSDFEWTMKAMHLACAMARNTGSTLILLHLRQVTNPALLGSGLGTETPSEEVYEQLGEYWMIAEDYGVTFTLQPMEYETLLGALTQSAEYLKASVMFAHLPDSILTFWNRLQKWNLRRQLTTQGCQLYTLERPEQIEEWMPSVSVVQ